MSTDNNQISPSHIQSDGNAVSISEQQNIIDKMITLGKTGSAKTAEQIVDIFGAAKKDAYFFRMIHQALTHDYPNSRDRRVALRNISQEVKNQELYSHLCAITESDITPYEALGEVKKFIGQYYEMIYRYLETESSMSKEESTYPYKDDKENKDTDKKETKKQDPHSIQLHTAEDFFNREDPLFRIALFLYQKELNSANRLLLKLREQLKQKKALFDFFLAHKQEIKQLIIAYQLESEENIKKKEQPQDATEIVEEEEGPKMSPYEKRYVELMRECLVMLDQTKYIDSFRKFEVRDIDKVIGDLYDDIEMKSQIVEALRREQAPLDRLFDNTKDHAKALGKDYAFMDTLRDNLNAMSNKFNAAPLNPLMQHAFHMRQMIQMTDYIHKNNKAGSYFSKTDFTQFRQAAGLTISQYDTYFYDGEDPVQRKLSMQQALEAIIGDQQIMNADKGLNELLTNQLQFTQTMSWFAHDTYTPHFVKNINLAGHNLGIPTAATLKGTLDKICGTLRKRQYKFMQFETPVPISQLLLTTPESSVPQDEIQTKLTPTEVDKMTASLLASLQGKDD